MKPEITMRSASDLIPYARNARTHSEQQIAMIAGSIRDFGFRNPVLVDGDNGIIAGHARVAAALKLDLSGSHHGLVAPLDRRADDETSRHACGVDD